MNKSIILDRILFLNELLKKENYEGYDPFDGLNSPLFQYVNVLNNLFIKRLFIHFIKINPFNIRNIFLIKKTKNDPKVLSDSIQSFILLEKYTGVYQEIILKELRNELFQRAIPTENGLGWGLEFPYTSRYTDNQKYPNLYTTVNCAYSLLKLHEKKNNTEIFQILQKVNNYIFKDLGVASLSSECSFIRYYKNLDVPVYNVNSLALKYLVSYQILTSDTIYSPIINRVLAMIMKNQNQDGSWYYSPGKKGNWIDGFHTGYIIEGLITYYNYFKDEAVLDSIKKATEYFKTKLLLNNFPLFKPNKKYPIDSQNCAQAIQTRVLLYTLGLDNINLINQMFLKIDKELTTSKGYYGYQRNRFILNNNHYLRWSSSPFILALSYLYGVQSD